MPAFSTRGSGIMEVGRQWLALFFPMLAATLLLWPTLSYVARVWLDDGTYSHGLLLLAVSVWLIYRDRRHHHWPQARPWWPGLAAVALIMMLYLVALLAAVEVLQRLLVLPLYLAVAATALGPAPTRRLLFPVLLLLLALPVWGLMIPSLQGLAVAVVSFLLDAWSIPARIEGNLISIPEGRFEVAQGCSGLRYLLVAATFALLWGHLYLKNRWHTLAFLAAALLGALLINWARIFLLVLIGRATDMQHPMMEDHNNLGWYVFAVALLPLIWWGRRLPHKDKETRNTATPPTTTATTTGNTAPALAAALILLLPLLAKEDAPSSRPLTFHPPIADESWRLQRPDSPHWAPQYQGLDKRWHLQYRQGQQSYRLYLGWYNRQHDGAELYMYGNRLVPEGWREQGVVAGCPDQAECRIIGRDDDRHVVVRWHIVNQRPVGSRLLGKWHQLLALVRDAPGAAVLGLETRCLTDCEESLQWLLSASDAVRRDTLDQLTGKEAAAL